MTKPLIHLVTLTAIALALSTFLLPNLSASKSQTNPPTRTPNMTLCTPSIEPGITVKVFDAQTQKPLQAVVTIQDGGFQEQLAPTETLTTGQIIYGGAFERPGNYTLTITHAGYQKAVMQAIEVTKDECHVITRKLEVRLQPN